ncbi:LysR family transcriptional regulator [Cohnella mopanensis]|uniref:LysR family transcriptional regulator n=1 Tax=Cohnella mopanensis TaxID=2911966 RepID=UPI001EF7A9C3|nr:LysR family transcriptional regulator [Cohnella mopanensis]
MQLDQLTFVVEIAKTGSLTAAANNMHVTLSAVSQSLSNLEAELGIPLFVRSRLGATPTAEGQELIKKAFEIVNKTKELKELAASYSTTQTGELRLAAFPGPLLLAMDAIIDFKQAYPYIRLEIHEKSITQIIEDVRHGNTDLGLIIMFEPMQHKVSGLSYGRLMEGRMVVAVNRDSPLALRKSVTLEELRHEPLVLYDDEQLKWFMERYQSIFDPANLLFYTNNTAAINKAVKDGMASTIGLHFSFLNEPSIQNREIVTVQLDIPDRLPVYLAWVRAEGKHFPKASELFIQKLKHRLEQYD